MESAEWNTEFEIFDAAEFVEVFSDHSILFERVIIMVVMIIE